ncbi:MAG: ribosome hibernation-promoting factor, HPF/YfiA family [Bacteroidia bacterium]
MNVKIHSVHFHADEKLIGFVQEKVDKLLHFYEDIMGGDVFLKLENADVHHNKITEIKIKTPGKTLFAKECCSTFEEATDIAVEALTKQLQKRKEKLRRGM